MNQAIFTFRHTFVKSLTDLNYYVDVLNSTVKRSFKIIITFYLLIGVLLTTIFTITTLPTIRTDVMTSIDRVVEYFPQDLELTWDGAQLESNVDTQIVVPFPDDIALPNSLPQSLAIIDTTTTDSPNERTASLIFVNQQELFVNSQRGQWSSTQLDNLIEQDTFVLNKDVLQSWEPEIQSDTQTFLNLLPLFMFMAFSIGLFISRLVMIAINSIIVQFMFMLMGKQLPYKKVFQLSLHLLIPVELLSQLSHLLYPQLEMSMTTVAYWSLIALLLWHLRNLHVLKFEEVEKNK